MTGSAARRVAIDALVAIERDDSYANLRLGTLLDRSGLDERDRGFVTEIVYGTIRRRATVDHLVDRFLSSEPPPIARAALRIGAYQLHVLGVPPHAAVAATVEATPKPDRFNLFLEAAAVLLPSHAAGLEGQGRDDADFAARSEVDALHKRGLAARDERPDARGAAPAA